MPIARRPVWRINALGAMLGASALAVLQAAASDWPTRDGDAAGRRYSTLTQITAGNVSRLEKAWEFDTGTGNLQVTPLVVNGVMYVGAGSSIWALEPETARVIWKFDAPDAVSRRGVAYWPGDRTAPARIISGAGDRMVALDAKTGAPVPAFGVNGYVDLKQGIVGTVDGRISLVSPPTIFKNIIITGGNNGEQSPSLGLYGDIRGWDVRSGRLMWSFHTVPREGEPGNDTWERDSWKSRSGTNTWSFFTVDIDRGIVYAPTGSPTADYFGGDRKGQNLFGNSVVALDATSGKLKWYRQFVHHDLWDFDLPAAPTLVDVRQNGRTIPALVVVTKTNMLFILNRETGDPIYGIEERPVPKSNVPGEESWPTQPFTVKPPPIGRMDFDPAKDFYSLTPEHAAFCHDLWDRNGLFTQGPFTPAPVDRFMVTFPSTIGGGNWNGTAYDPTLGLAITNVMNLGQVGKMQLGRDRSGNAGYVRTTPWGGPVGRFWNPANKIPCNVPPFGELVAVNVNTGDIAWHVPLGFIDELKAKGFSNTGALNMGGPIVTAGGLVFVGASNDRRFRAFDTKSGRQLWETELEASAHSVPMTFMGRDNRQYVVVAAGGGSFLASAPGTRIVAFALPGGSSRQTASRSAPVPAAAARPVAAAPGDSGELPAGPGRETVVKLCANCHGLAMVTGARRTAADWKRTTDDMLARAHEGTPADAADIVGYLTSRFGRVDVNVASGQELSQVLGLAPAEAAAIVEYRTHEGGIRTFEDLRNVPGLDFEKLQRQRDSVIVGGP
jgi:competence ComEA-like helix-hairpin-helix protein